MGCFQSLDDKRRGTFAADWAPLEYAAVSGFGGPAKFCPLDALVVEYLGGKGKELKDKIGEMPLSEEKAKELVKEVWEGMKGLHKSLSETKDDDKADAVYGCYSGKEAFTQMDACMTDFAANSHSELKWPEEAPAEKPAGMEEAAGDMGEAAGEAAEGGEEAAAADAAPADAAPAEAAPKAAKELKAWGEFAAVTDLPKLLTALAFTYNVFGDAISAETMHRELGGSEFSNKLAGAATLIGAYCAKEALGEGAAEGDSYAPALLTENDVATVKEALDLKDKENALIFPGAIASHADLTKAEGEFYKKDGYTKVVYKMTSKTFKGAEGLHVAYRPFFTVEKWEEPAEGKDYCLVTLTPFSKHVFADIAAWTAACEAAGAAVATAVEAGKEAAGMGEKPPAMEEPAAAEAAEGDGM